MFKTLSNPVHVVCWISLKAALVFAFFLCSSAASAKSYKCIESDGQILYADKGCPPGTKPYSAKDRLKIEAAQQDEQALIRAAQSSANAKLQEEPVKQKPDSVAPALKLPAQAAPQKESVEPKPPKTKPADPPPVNSKSQKEVVKQKSEVAAPAPKLSLPPKPQKEPVEQKQSKAKPADPPSDKVTSQGEPLKQNQEAVKPAPKTSLTAVTHSGQVTAEVFHGQVRALYNFSPRLLSPVKKDEKTQALDKFWSEVTHDSKNKLPLLRKELQDATHASFFYYDGGRLLLKLSHARSDRLLALQALSHVDLRDVDGRGYVELVHWFAINGFDTREAAFNVLKYSEFNAHFPQHALTLKQDYSLVFMLFPMKESIFVEDLVKRMAHERNRTAQKSLLQALWYAATPEAIAVIKKTAGDVLVPDETKAYARKLLGRLPNSFLSKQRWSVDEPLREARRKVMRRKIGDESLIEFVQVTKEITEKQ